MIYSFLLCVLSDIFTVMQALTAKYVRLFPTHLSRTIRANAAIGAEKIKTIGTFSAVFAQGTG